MRREQPEVVKIAAQDSLPAAPTVVIQALKPFLTDKRLERLERIIGRRTRSIVPVLDGLIDPHNIAAVLRSADAFGVQEVHVVERTEPFMASSRVATGAQQWLDLVRHTSIEECISSLHKRQFQIYTAVAKGSLKLDDLVAQARVAVIFGNEHEGVSSEVIRRVDGTITIPMKGFVDSLNVSVAAAITLYCTTFQRPGDLTEEEKTQLRARFMMLSVKRAEQVVKEYLRRREL